MATDVKKRKVIDRSNIVHTVYGQALMTANALGIPYPILENTTLNERFGVQAGLALNPSERPAIKYFCIGWGAHDMVRESGKPTKTDLYKHQPEDAGQFQPMPFVLRQLNNDLSASEREHYGLRRKENINGVDYIAYYAKRLNFDTAELKIIRDQVDDGVLTSAPFIPTSQNLNPERPELPPRGITVASNIKLRNNVELMIHFTPEDAEELLNVARILFGEEDYAIISEIGLCSGVDREVTSAMQGAAPLKYKEIIGCQIAAHISVYRSISESNLGFKIFFDMGSRTPLAAERSLDTTAYYTEAGLVGNGIVGGGAASSVNVSS